jgi:dTDP-4-amino-4,6-dideoxygalactose transaminase
LNFHGLGINGKISELQAAMGLAVLPNIETILESRKTVVDIYDKDIRFDKISRPKLLPSTIWNYSYYPILLLSEKDLLKVENALKSVDVLPRRYFYPSLCLLPYVKSDARPISMDISKRILCLPLFHGLMKHDVKNICKIVNETLTNQLVV